MLSTPTLKSAGSVLLLITGLILNSTSGAAEKQTAASIEPVYRAYAFAANPRINPAAKFAFEEFAPAGLWESLGLQIFKVWFVNPDVRAPRDPVILVDGKFSPFVNTTGGGLLSAVVHGDALYFSYGFGSGIHRSQLGRLRLRGGQPELHESKSYGMADMLVEKTGERVRVVVRDFPHPDEPSLLGWIDLTETERLKVVDDVGVEVVLPMSVRPLTREETMRRRAKMAPYVKSQDIATRRMLEAMGIIIDANNHAFINPAMDDPTKIDVVKVSAAVDAWNLLTIETRRP
ncbi:MAG: hypothetical protein HY736_04205 [Verrucomicrobia bacterium]|nr:hypothetical protein [Verrucomicrobiota bacterium]